MNARMSRHRRRSLERKLAAYAVTSGAMLASATQAPAEIIYSGLRDVAVQNQQTVNFNINDTGPLADAVTDAVFRHTNTISGLNQTLTLAVTPSGTNQVVVDSGGFAAALAQGAEISSADTLGTGSRTMATYQFKLNSLQSSAGPWRGADNLFLGLRFVASDNLTHFGWARISVSAAATSTATATIHDWAYETTPDARRIAKSLFQGSDELQCLSESPAQVIGSAADRKVVGQAGDQAEGR